MRLSIYLLAGTALIAACASDTVTLRPAPDANLAPAAGSQNAAADMLSGVRVTAMPRSWPGRMPIENVVTPLRVRVDNNSGNPVLIRYDKISLTSPGGKIFAALPPYSIDATVSLPRLASGHPVWSRPYFTGSLFAVSPLYASAYPGFPMAAGPYLYDPFYYSHFGHYWRNITLPTPEMLRLALPEGIIGAGGSADGFIYFEEVSRDVSRVQFRMDVLNASNGETMGTINIPFVVSAS